MFASINLSIGQNSRKCPDDGVQLSKDPQRQDSTTRKSLDGGGGGGDEVPTRKAPVRRESSTTSKSLDCGGGDEVPLKKGPVRQKLDDWKVFRRRNVRKLEYGEKETLFEHAKISRYPSSENLSATSGT